MEIFVNVTNQKLSISSSFCNVVSGSQEFVKFKFILGEEWGGLLTFAQFTQNGHAYNSYLDENNCAYLPSEIQGGTCTLMLYGADGTIKATTNYLTLKVESSALISDASSTDISQSLYDQLVERFNRIADLSESDYSDLIVQQVGEIMAGYLSHGDLTAMTLQDGTVSRTKVNSAFEATLAKADNSWQKSANAPSGTWEATYDPQGIQDDIFNYVSVANNTTKTYIDGQISNVTNRSGTGTLDTARQEIADARIFQSDYTPQYNPTVIGGQFNYNTLKDSLHGVYQQSKAYADAKFRDYSPFDIQFLEQPPTTSSEAGEERTFYLVPKTDSNGNITGYDKWWYIQNADGYWVWDTFGSTSTVVTTAANLPTVGDPDTDYIVAVDGGYIYKKYINNQWVVIAGSMAKVLTAVQFEALQSGDELTDYYVPNSDGVYLHYRWINNDFELIGSDSYSKSEVDAIIRSTTNTLGDRISSVERDAQTAKTNVTAMESSIQSLGDQISQTNDRIYEYTANITTDENTGVSSLHLIKEKDNNTPETVVTLTLPSGGSSSGTPINTSLLNVTRVTTTPIMATPTDSIFIVVNCTSVSNDNDQVSLECTYTLKKGNDVIMSGKMLDGNNSFDVTKYCSVGQQKFTLTVTDEYGSMNVKTWSVQVVDVRMTVNYDDTGKHTIGRTVDFSYIPYGGNNLSKTVHFKLDGIDLNSVTTTTSGTPMTYYIQPQAHGSHLLECWITATVNQTVVETEHIFKNIIWYDPDKDNNDEYLAPVVGCIYRYDYYGVVEVRQYDTLPIVYDVFDPANDYPVVKRYVDDVLVGEDTVDTSHHIWNFNSGVVGQHILRIECGETVVVIRAKVNELGIDVSPITANLEIDFNPTGVNNNSSNRLWSNSNYSMTVSENFDWVNGGYHVDENGDTYFLVKSGTKATFNYYMFAGTQSDNIRNTGAEMKIVFMTENVQRADATWFSNAETTTIENNGQTKIQNIGIQLNVHDGWLKTNNAKTAEELEAENAQIIANGGTVDDTAATNTYLYIPYSEEDIIELDINIDRADTSSGSVGSCIMAYEDGVPSKAFIYGSDRLYQRTSVEPIVIGSDYCDVRIYRMKIYSNMLTPEDIMRNFIADSRDSVTMLERYDRNSIYYNSTSQTYSPYSSNGVLDPVALAPMIPNVKVLMLETDHFTTSKKTFVKSSLRCIHAPGGDLYPGDAYYDNWLFENGYHSGQGTTSDNYGDSARNVDFIFNCDGIHRPYYEKDNNTVEPNYISQVTFGKGLGQGNEHTDYVTDWQGDSGKVTLTRTSIPNNFFNFKVNVASSENVNNALLQKRYNDFLLQLYNSPAHRRDSRIKNDMEFVPAVLFVKETNPDVTKHTEFKDNEYHFYALGNLGDSKKTDYTRAYDPEDMNEFTIEISDNTPNNATFQTGVYMAYEYNQVNSPNVNNLGDYFEYVNERYVRTTDTSLTASKTYYTRNGTRTVESFTLDNGKAKSDANPQECVYPISMAEWNNTNMRYWCLYNEPFDGKYSFEPRYACCGDYRDGKLVNITHGTEIEEQDQINKNNDVWRAFYRWVITSTDAEFVSELDQWCVRNAVEFFYAFTHMYTMIDNRAKNTFWHFAKTGTYRAVSKPVSELLHVYCELINDEYIPTEDTTINANKTYYTQYAFDLWMYDGDTGVGINNNGELIFPYGKEDTDFNVDGDEQSGYMYNGALSVFWCRLRDLLPEEISSTFNNVERECFRADSLITQFDNFQNCYPEEIWRLDIERKYLRVFNGLSIDNSIESTKNTTYLKKMMQGRKKYQRRQWMRDQEIYFGTKHLVTNMLSAGNQNVNQIVYRCYNPGSSAVVAPNYNLYITPFTDMYVSVKFANTTDIQQKRAKAGIPCEIEIAAGNATDTQVIIYAANRIQALNDLSATYMATLDISNASRLRKLVIGNATTGYRNNRLSELSLTNNTLLEELDIRNCTAISGELNLENCKNLVKILAEGTALETVIFANQGRVEVAHLPNTVGSLTMRNLNNLSDLQGTYTFLTDLILEGGTINSKEMVSTYINTLQAAQLYNIDWTGQTNSLTDTTLLNQLYAIDSKITGNVHIAGSIKPSEYNNYGNKWKNLTVTYNSMTTEYLATFLNYDNTVLFTQYVDSGSTPFDPVTNGNIPTPTRPDDGEYTYTFDGWSDMSSMNSGDRPIRATYSRTPIEYTVRWYSDMGGSVVYTVEHLHYGDEAIFVGTLPTKTGYEQNNQYYVFTGWDKSTGCVKGNMDVYPVWEHANGLPNPNTTDLSTMTCAEIYGVSQAVAAGRVTNISDYYEDKDYFDLPLGQDFDFNPPTGVSADTPGYVRSEALIENSNATGIDKYTEGMFFNGTNYLDTNLRLFDTDSESFTLAIDYEFIDSTAANNGDDQTLVSCAIASNSGEGFRIHRVGTGSALLKWSTQNAINHKLGRGTNRNMLVLRHTKGSKFLHIYTSDKQASLTDNADDSTNVYDMTITVAHEKHKTEPWTNSNGRDGQVLTFGALRSADGLEHSGFATGWIHWCKIWHDDLGDDVAKKLASWTHEKVRMEYYGTRRYDISGSSPRKRASASFLANNPLALLGRMNSTNTNAGGWVASQMRTFLKTRVYDALAYKWQNIIKTVEVMSSPGNSDSSGEVVTSNDKLYLPANREVGGNTSSPYKDEVLNQTTISFLASIRLRLLKFPGVILGYPKSTNHPDGLVFISESSDPTNSELTSYAAYTGDSGSSTVEITKSARPIRDGDVWLNQSDNNVGYIYISSSTISKHSRIGFRNISTNNIQAADGGYWIRASGWWNRSPYSYDSNKFIYVSNSGYSSTSGDASSPFGVVLGLSI